MSPKSKSERKQQKRSKNKARVLASLKKRKARVAKDRLLTEDDPVVFENHTTVRGDIDAAQSLQPKHRRDVEELIGELEESRSKQPPKPEREETEADIWWNKYTEADGVTRVQMTREKLEVVSPDDEEYEHFFPEAISELQSKLSPQDYVVFLEELREAHPQAFALSADWNTESIVLEYLAQKRLDDVNRATILLAGQLQEIGGPFFSLMSTLRLAGRGEACQCLIDAAVNKLEDASLMGWAVGDVLEWAMFAHYQRCVADGVTDDAVKALHIAARDLGVEDEEESRANRRDVALHLAGKSGTQWNKEELVSRDEKKAFHNIYLLGVDYQRWLCEERGFEAIVADELRRLVIRAIGEIDRPFSGLLTGLPRHDFDRYLARKLGFLSLDRIACPATIVAMKHYYGFLQDLGLVKPKHGKDSQSVCDDLWNQLKRTFRDDEWRTYTFLEEYLPVA